MIDYHIFYYRVLFNDKMWLVGGTNPYMIHDAYLIHDPHCVAYAVQVSGLASYDHDSHYTYIWLMKKKGKKKS